MTRLYPRQSAPVTQETLTAQARIRGAGLAASANVHVPATRVCINKCGWNQACINNCTTTVMDGVKRAFQSVGVQT